MLTKFYFYAEKNETLRRIVHRCQDDIKVDLKSAQWERVDSHGSGYGPVRGSFEHGKRNSIKKKVKFSTVEQLKVSQ